MSISKYITLEQDIQRIKNCLTSVGHLINEDKFKSYGRYAHCYGRNYNGGDIARHQVRRTMNNLNRLFKTSVSKGILNTNDKEVLLNFLQLQIKFINFQHLTTF